MEKEVLTIPEAAEYLSVSEKTIRRMIKADELPAAKIRSVWRIKKTDIESLFPNTNKKVSGC
jgi:excisionase family DNA binding protein